MAQSVARRLGKAEVGGSSPLDSFEPFPGSARKCGVFGVFLLWKFLSCAVFPLLGNIILGGLLYYVINLLHIVHMPWSFFDIVVIAIFGIPGTVFLAIFHFFFQ